MNTGLTDKRVRALIIDPQDSNVLYVGSGDFSDASTSGGVFKSADKGTSWKATKLTNHWVLALAFAPAGSRTIYAGTDQGVMASTDGGNSWAGIKTEVVNHYVLSLAIAAKGRPILYAGTEGNSIFAV